MSETKDLLRVMAAEIARTLPVLKAIGAGAPVTAAMREQCAACFAVLEGGYGEVLADPEFLSDIEGNRE